MTEAEWNACTDSLTLLEFLGGKASVRKRRLFGCACVRCLWNDLPDDALRQAIETCERFEDGRATADELHAARQLAEDTYQGIGDIIADHSAIGVTALCHPKPSFPTGGGSSWGISAVVAEVRFNEETPWHVAFDEAERWHCTLLRDVFGPLPFRPVKLDGAWLTPTVTGLAETFYQKRAFDNLPILADALEDAGCTNADILNHCRQPGEHVRGCWVVDLLLGKQ